MSYARSTRGYEQPSPQNRVGVSKSGTGSGAARGHQQQNHVGRGGEEEEDRHHRHRDRQSSSAEHDAPMTHHHEHYPNKRSRRDDYYHSEGHDQERQQEGQKSYYGHYNHDDVDMYAKRSNRHENDDWKCKECMTYNYSEHKECVRCGVTPDHLVSRTDQSHPRYESYPQDDEEVTYKDECNNDTVVDEFGRIVRDKNQSASGPIDTEKSTKKLGPPGPEWPPCFDSSGTAFLFDSRSGMFYNTESDFFYDPKSKLYYGNKQRSYYQYDASSNPPFRIVSNVESTSMNESATCNLDPLLASGTSTQKGTSSTIGPTISINLKTKSLGGTNTKDKSRSGGPSSVKTTDVPVASRKLTRQHASDMEKWSERKEEAKALSAEASTTITKSKSETTPLIKTSKGEPICLLCRRKFPSIAKLQYHEQVSALHKENLAKKEHALALQKSNDSGIGPSVSTYIDRAENRRMMYSTAVVIPPALPTTMFTNACRSGNLVDPSTAATAAAGTSVEVFDNPKDNLGETNIGNQLLQKMGWKEGHTVGGRPDSDDSTPTAASTNPLTKDWDKIEALAAANAGTKPSILGRSKSREAGVGF